ncbi:Predicted nucleotidyltransferase [Marinitoga hydrogenitolerans DSM 16785]|uniref:Predicted nucleotidyltransferase n=1 Tax=Marinitoga hydrogenitolerans (strain DSM 16785 / JCM 12826 / AT1271) TaxID=1122195 RepID=A0A1M4S9V4_MARH1|nr:nucleotidyltransferase domain-containing protein [Marinitoga hydrogenitolerans]SHE28827.1 Predicted nucleotidyltransferase [Marinitoga hydrogenitolerans DSM 16785]
MKFGLKEELLDNLIKIFSNNKKIKRVILFGSRAKGNFKNGSDIDIALYGEDLNINDIISIQVEIEKLEIPYGIDLIIYNKIDNKELKEHIDRVGKFLYKRD